MQIFVDFPSDAQMEFPMAATSDLMNNIADVERLAARRGALTRVERELIFAAVNLSVHLHDIEAAKSHLKRARDAGATDDEIRALLLAGLVGQQTLVRCVPVLLEELKLAGLMEALDAQSIEMARAHKAAVLKKRNMGASGWDAMLELDPGYMQRYERIVDTIAPSRRMLELLVIAIDGATTNLHISGGTAHIRSALAFGISHEEILEVLELVSLIGFKAVKLGLEAVKQAQSLPKSAPDPTEIQHNYLAFDEAETIASMPKNYVKHYHNLQQKAIETRKITEAERHLIYFSLSISVHRNDLSSAVFHARRALNAGATVADLLGCLKVSTNGIQTLRYFATAVRDTGEKAGKDFAPDSQNLVSDLLSLEWSQGLEDAISIDPEFVRAMRKIDDSETLSPRLDALTMLAVACSPANPAQKLPAYFVHKALDCGLCVPEISELLKIVSMCAYRTAYLGSKALRLAIETPLDDVQDGLFPRITDRLPEKYQQFYSAYLGLEDHAMRRNALPQAERQTLMFALQCIIHTSDIEGAVQHARAAIAAGATEEMLKGSLILGGFGLHMHGWATPTVLNELDLRGLAPEATAEIQKREDDYRSWCMKFRGYDGMGYAALVRLELEFMYAYHELTGQPLTPAHLTEKIIVCGDCSPNHLSESGSRVHIKKGLAVGLTSSELLEVQELSALSSFRAALDLCTINGGSDHFDQDNLGEGNGLDAPPIPKYA